MGGGSLIYYNITWEGVGAPQFITILHRGRGGELKGGLKSYSGLHMFLGGAKRTHSDSYSEKCHEYVFLGEYA